MIRSILLLAFFGQVAHWQLAFGQYSGPGPYMSTFWFYDRTKPEVQSPSTNIYPAGKHLVLTGEIVNEKIGENHVFTWCKSSEGFWIASRVVVPEANWKANHSGAEKAPIAVASDDGGQSSESLSSTQSRSESARLPDQGEEQKPAVSIPSATSSVGKLPEEANGHIEFNINPKDVVVERVAVVATKGEDCSGQMRTGQELASYVEGSMLGIYDVVERRNLERVLDEQKLALSGILYEQSTVEAGCNVGAQGIIFTEFGCISNVQTIQVKLVDCQTSELYWSAIGHGSNILEVMKKIKASLPM